MYFTKDKKEGFKNFDQCYAHWWNKAQTDDTIDISKLFGVTRNFQDTIIHNTGTSKHPEYNQDRKSLGYVEHHLREIEFFRELEDEL